MSVVKDDAHVRKRYCLRNVARDGKNVARISKASKKSYEYGLQARHESSSWSAAQSASQSTEAQVIVIGMATISTQHLQESMEGLTFWCMKRSIRRPVHSSTPKHGRLKRWAWTCQYFEHHCAKCRQGVAFVQFERRCFINRRRRRENQGGRTVCEWEENANDRKVRYGYWQQKYSKETESFN